MLKVCNFHTAVTVPWLLLGNVPQQETYLHKKKTKPQN